GLPLGIRSPRAGPVASTSSKASATAATPRAAGARNRKGIAVCDRDVMVKSPCREGLRAVSPWTSGFRRGASIPDSWDSRSQKSFHHLELRSLESQNLKVEGPGGWARPTVFQSPGWWAGPTLRGTSPPRRKPLSSGNVDQTCAHNERRADRLRDRREVG